MKVMVILLIVSTLGTVSKGLEKSLDELEIGGYAETIEITKIGQNIEKSPRDLRRLAVTQTPVKDLS